MQTVSSIYQFINSTSNAAWITSLQQDQQVASSWTLPAVGMPSHHRCRAAKPACLVAEIFVSWRTERLKKKNRKGWRKGFWWTKSSRFFRWVFLKLNPNRLGSMQYVQIMHLFSIADMLQDSRKKPWKSQLCPSKSRSLRAAACNRISLSFWSSSLRCFKVATSFGSMMWQGDRVVKLSGPFFGWSCWYGCISKRINFTKRFISTYHNLLFLAELGNLCEHTENRSTASNDKAKALSDIKPAKNQIRKFC